MRLFHLLAGASALAVVAHPAAAQQQVTPTETAAAPNTAPSAPVSEEVVAASDATTGLSEEIVVTAQKRSENAQKVPISLTALSQGALEKASINNVQDLQRVVPSFSAYRAPQAANTRLSIRGIGSSGNAAIEPSVGAFVDGIYIPRPGPLLAGLNDIASVEVLRGPQGTLFGRNASVGAISFHTTEPKSTLEELASLEYGSFNRVRATAIANIPVTSSLATRLAVLYDRFDGYGLNTLDGGRFGNSRTFSVRASARWDVTSSLRWILRGDYQAQRGDGATTISVDASTVTPTAAANFAIRLNGLQPILNDTYSFRVRQITGGHLTDDQFGIASDLSLEVGKYTLRLLSGYRDWDNRQSERDISLTAADLFGRDAYYRSKSHSEELQLVSPADQRLTFVGGLYYFREDYTIGTVINLEPGYCPIFIKKALPTRLAACLAGPQQNASNNLFNQVTESFAGYGQATFKITPTWDVTGGLRYSQDNKNATLQSLTLNSAAGIISVTDNAVLKFDGGKLTYRANTTFRPTRDVMLFGTVSTGYKSGGFDSGTGSVLGNNRVFQPEETTNYEVGVKSELFSRKLLVNATAFRMDISNYQLRSYNGVAFSVRNAGSIRQQGVEFEVTGHLTPDLTLGVSGTRLFSKFTDFRNAPNLPGFGGIQNLTGTRVSFSPDWQGVASADYRRDIGHNLAVGLNTRLSFVSDIDVGSAGDHNPQGIQPGYALLGARLSLYGRDDRWEVALSGENLTEKGYCTLRYSQTFGGPLGLNDVVSGGTVQRCVLGEPRVVRVSGKIRI